MSCDIVWGSEYRIKYEPDADALYVWIREGRVVDSDEVSDGVIVDYDEDGNVLGIEILEFSKRKIDLNELVIRGFRVPVEA
ncbi:MAG: DUF2283 domain-containing protein [Candidatus Bathyarchaeia archaeon]